MQHWAIIALNEMRESPISDLLFEIKRERNFVFFPRYISLAVSLSLLRSRFPMVAELGDRPFLLPLRVRASTSAEKRTERVVLCLLVCPPANEIS